MGKRGRKPSSESTEKKGYFYEKQERAVLEYLETDSKEEKERIFEEILQPAFDKMIESIIRRYSLYIPNEDTGDTFNDVYSFLINKTEKFEPEIKLYKEIPKTKLTDNIINNAVEYKKKKDIPKRVKDDDPILVYIVSGKDENKTITYYERVTKKVKAYSYYGTICKNYLIGRLQKYSKTLERNPSYDTMADSIINNIEYSDKVDRGAEVADETIEKLIIRLRKMVSEPYCNDLKLDELKLGKALLNLFEHWDFVLTTDCSTKFNKSTILFFLKEQTGLDAKGIRDNLKKFKKEFLIIKNDVLNY